MARAFGQKAIEAQVVVWQVAGPLSWEASTGRPRCEAVGQPTEISGATNRLRREGARLQDRVLLTARGLLAALRMALGSPAAEWVRSRNVLLLALTTIGFPSTMAALSWAEDELE